MRSIYYRQKLPNIAIIKNEEQVIYAFFIVSFFILFTSNNFNLKLQLNEWNFNWVAEKN